MNEAQRCFSVQYLLCQTFEKRFVPIDEHQEVRPFDCDVMSLFTFDDTPNAFQLVVGESWLSSIQKYALYYSTRLRKRCALVCTQSTAESSLLSMLSFATGISLSHLVSHQISEDHFEILYDRAGELYQSNLNFYEMPEVDIAGLVSFAKKLKRRSDVEVLIIDGLHHLKFEKGRKTTKLDRRLISAILQSLAHKGEFIVTAGYESPGEPFPNLHSDATFYCGKFGFGDGSNKLAGETLRANSRRSTTASKE